MVCEKLKVIYTCIYFVTCVHKTVLNIVSTKLQHKNVKLQICIWPSKYKKSGVFFFYFDNFYSLMLEDNIAIYLSFIIISGNFLIYMYITCATQILQWKLRKFAQIYIFDRKYWKQPLFILTQKYDNK